MAVLSIPLSLYVHLPWCVRKCPYCDFNSHALRGKLPERRYLKSLLEDIERSATGLRRRPVTSIFFGGGTPSLFSAASIATFLDKAGDLLTLAPGVEITLEANPGTIERDNFRDYLDAGINRVSLGAQSFDDNKLKALGRIHRASETLIAVAELEKAGLENFNLDIMYGLPGQTPPEALADMEQTLDLQPTHVSHYQLTLEPNTLFARNPPILPDHDACWEIQQQCHERLAQAGFDHYEISAFAKPNRQCEHNVNYWTFGDYMGLGAGAHGKISDERGVMRYWRFRQPEKYMAVDDTVEGSSILRPDDLIFEFMLNALRLEKGFPLDLFARRTGLARAKCAVMLEQAVDNGLLTINGIHCQPSALGMNFRNNLMAIFLPESSATSPAGSA